MTMLEPTNEKRALMQDEMIDQPISAGVPRRTGRRFLLGLVLLLLLILGAVIAARRIPEFQQKIDSLIGLEPSAESAVPDETASPSTGPALVAAPAVTTPALAAPMPVLNAPATTPAETRLAALEARIAQLDLQAQAASGNATRAEGLLIAFAARRTLERGEPLGYLEDQLKLRFADAQPNAVQTLIAAAQTPVSLDQLYGQLDVLRPKLAGKASGEDSWSRIKRELAGLFVLRRQEATSVSPENNLERARILLASGKVTEAIGEVERMPGAAAAQTWVVAARRYDAVQRALDLIETTAMLEPRRLRDDQGATVKQPSPLAAPTAATSL